MNRSGHSVRELAPGLNYIEQLFADEFTHGRMFNAEQTLDVRQGQRQTMGFSTARLRLMVMPLLRREDGAALDLSDQDGLRSVEKAGFTDLVYHAHQS